MILFFNEQKHIGGGQTVIEAYRQMLSHQKIPFEYYDSGLTLAVIWKIFCGYYSTALINIYGESYLPLLLLLKLKRVEVIFPIYGIWFLERHGVIGVRARFDQFLHRIIFACSSTLITFSEYAKKLTVTYFPATAQKIVVIPCGTDETRFFSVSPQRKKSIRNQLDLPIKATICLVVSRLDNRKRLDLAFEAFYEASKTDKNLVLYLIFPTGEFNTLAILDRLFKQINILGIGKKVHFITGIDEHILPLYFQASDIFIMSSLAYEHFGITILEALATGMIPVCFRNSAMPELLNQVDKKLTAFPLEVSALARTIKWAASLSTVKRKQLLKKAQKVSSKYTWKMSEKKFIATGIGA